MPLNYSFINECVTTPEFINKTVQLEVQLADARFSTTQQFFYLFYLNKESTALITEKSYTTIYNEH